MISVRLPLVLLLLLLLPLTSWSAELTGRVARIVEGDTLVLLDASNTQQRSASPASTARERPSVWPAGQAGDISLLLRPQRDGGVV